MRQAVAAAAAGGSQQREGWVTVLPVRRGDGDADREAEGAGQDAALAAVDFCAVKAGRGSGHDGPG
jgi:hypothetical protein